MKPSQKLDLTAKLSELDDRIVALEKQVAILSMPAKPEPEKPERKKAELKRK